MEMEIKETGDVQEDWSSPASPIVVLQKLSEETVRRASEALHGAYSGSPILKTPPRLDPAPTHRRVRSEVVASFHRRSSSNSSFQKWKSQMQKALHLNGSSFHEGRQSPSFDPEILANQKRQWYQLQSKTSDHEKYKEPASLFELFIVVGLHPDTNLEVVEDAFIRRKKWEQEMARAEILDNKMLPYRRPTLPTLEPQVLFMYPPGNKLALRLKDLAAFCFPEGVKAQLLEKTPSLSELNELIYGQEHLSRDDLSFIFSLKVADSATLYGVCLHIREFVQKPHAISGVSSNLPNSHSGCSRFLAPAPRCYCFLTRVPFFELHFEILNSIISQDRLNRITQFVSEISLADHVSTLSISKDHRNGNAESPSDESDIDWMALAIPVNSAIALTAAAAGIISDEDVPSKRQELHSPTANDSSNQLRRLDTDDKTNMHQFDNSSCKEVNQINDNEKMCRIHFNGHNPDGRQYVYPRTQSLEHCPSFAALFSSARAVASETEVGETFSDHNEDPTDATDNKNNLLRLVCDYHSIPLPARGSQIKFQPLEHLQAIEYRRPPISALGLCEEYLDIEMKDHKEVSQVNLKLAIAEEAASLSLWTTATICRVLSLESILALVTGVLLEKQVVVFCPNLGVLSALVLSIIPIIRPFEWQSLFLPILPGTMLEFLDAPVPFIVGVQHKTVDLKKKTSDLISVNVVKNQVKTCNLPLLPQRKELISELAPIHSTLSRENSISQKHPVYKCNELQAEAASQFLLVMRRYLESLCADLRSHALTSVQSNDDRVSILLKDSFIDSFPVREQSFVKLFVETQLFTVLSDSRLASLEHEYTK